MEVFSERLWPDAGLRIDHLLLSPPLAKHLVAAGVDREVRGREHASDQHPPGLGLNATPGRASRPKWESLKMTSADRFDLERFVTAQTPVFETVLAELRAGRKRTHWMWFVFPQLSGLGRSSTAGFTASVPLMKRARIWPTPCWGQGSISAPGSCSRAKVRPFMRFSARLT